MAEVLSNRADALVALIQRLGCVPRFVAARNAQLGSPLTSLDLEDVVQDTLLVVWRKLPHFHGRVSLEIWIYRICCYELLNAVRRSSRRDGRRLGPAEPEADEGGPDPRPGGAQWERAERHERLYGALDSLTLGESEVVRLKHFDDLSFTEIGRQLGISANTAKTRYYRGLRRLSILLRDRGSAPPSPAEGPEDPAS